MKNYCKVCGKECYDEVDGGPVDTCSVDCYHKELEHTVLEYDTTQYQFSHFFNRCEVSIMNITEKTNETVLMSNVTARQIKFAMINSGWEQV